MSVDAVSFDLFGTLVTVDRPANPATAIAEELDAVDVPSSEYWEEISQERWKEVYTTTHVEVADGAELSLPRHVTAALMSDIEEGEPASIQEAVEQAVCRAFDRPVETRPGAPEVVRRLAEQRQIGVLSNCSVPGLVDKTLTESVIDTAQVDAVVTSVECGWRKPDPAAFEGIANELGFETGELVHIGDDAVADGGITNVGGRFVHTEGRDLGEVPEIVTDDQRVTSADDQRVTSVDNKRNTEEGNKG